MSRVRRHHRLCRRSSPSCGRLTGRRPLTPWHWSRRQAARQQTRLRVSLRASRTRLGRNPRARLSMHETRRGRNPGTLRLIPETRQRRIQKRLLPAHQTAPLTRQRPLHRPSPNGRSDPGAATPSTTYRSSAAPTVTGSARRRAMSFSSVVGLNRTARPRPPSPLLLM